MQVDVQATQLVEDESGELRNLRVTDLKPTLGARFNARVGSAALSGHRVVTPGVDGRLVYASPALAEGALWLTMQAGDPNAVIEVLSFGEVIEPGWFWTPRQKLYLADNGNLGTSPSAGTSVQVATALTASSIFVDPKTPIRLT